MPIGIIALILGFQKLPATLGSAGRGFDFSGLATFSAGAVLIVTCLLRGEISGWASPTIIGGFADGVVLLTVFVVIERVCGEDATLDLNFFSDHHLRDDLRHSDPRGCRWHVGYLPAH